MDVCAFCHVNTHFAKKSSISRLTLITPSEIYRLQNSTRIDGKMIAGFKHSKHTPVEVADRLRAALAASNFLILNETPQTIDFEHGTYMTSTVSMLPKKGKFEFFADGNGTKVNYQVEVTGFAKYWMAFISIAFCWLIFPFILTHRALKIHPKRQMENLLQAV